ncbi:hypothetical protein G4Y73_06000 [Wenzhouxiangella sp. XN201]|uniref:type II secretion system protein M n=1 Tax=Wenzhouxiangella sp. XN201 TaxID=2710755 RepID=UPI0013C903E6|nr:type II secretion system protein M [Wenzhouxiangella sp. XN201]NEZ03707.1 hypothetical protein [Wenzhouxiangella sp. XN201]
MSMQARLRQTGERINALSLRERALLLLAVLAVVFLLWDLFAMQPVADRQSSVQDRLEQTRERLDELNASIQRLATSRTRHPDRALEQRAVSLESEIADLEQGLGERFGGIATPQQSLQVLAGLLSERAGVTIVELENLPPASLESSAGEAVPGIFIHQVRVVVETDFAGVRDYLDGITELPTGVFWKALELSVPGWPVNRVELVLYSLALDDHWLGV